MSIELTHCRSSVVEKVLLQAHEDGKKFSVIVVDSKPLLEGEELPFHDIHDNFANVKQERPSSRL